MKSNDHLDRDTWTLIKRISENVKAKRKERGLTQVDMAALGFGPRWYQRLESGRHIPTVPTLHRLAKALGIDISELFK